MAVRALHSNEERTPSSPASNSLGGHRLKRETDGESRVQRDRARAILKIIDVEAPRTIEDVARRLNLSHSHLKHVFKRQTGLSLGHSLTERKLRRAADLLTRTQLCIKEIGYLSGYRHTSSFIRAFARYYMCAPQSYRRGINETSPAHGRLASDRNTSDRTARDRKANQRPES
jgi:AraC-like DNA-binding protein